MHWSGRPELYNGNCCETAARLHARHSQLPLLPFLLPCSSLYPNVDFYSGIVLRALGIPVEMYTVLFAMARTVGWVAQVGKGVRGWNEGCSGVCRAGMLCRLILAVVLRCCCCSGPLLA